MDVVATLKRIRTITTSQITLTVRANPSAAGCAMVPTQIWGGYPRGGVGAVGFDEGVGRYLKNQSLPEQISDPVADGWNRQQLSAGDAA